MGIIVRLDQVMSNRKIRLLDLAEKIGITYANLSNLKNGKVTAIRFSTLESICKELNCQPGDILEYLDDDIIKYIETFAENDNQKEGALNRLYAYAKNKGEKNISLELAKECFQMVEPITKERIASVVTSYFNITMEELISKTRIPRIIKAREIALYLCKLQTHSKFKEICDYFNVDASSFVFACDKIEEDFSSDKELQTDIIKILREIGD